MRDDQISLPAAVPGDRVPLTGRTVREAGPDESAAIVSLLSDAFLDDPLMVTVAPDPGLRRETIESAFSGLVAAALDDGRIAVSALDGRVLGAALWTALLPARRAPVQASAEQPRAVPSADVTAVLRSLRAHERLGRDPLQRSPGPAAYLWLLGVDAAARGQGVGAALVRAVALDARAAGFASLALKTERAENQGFYRGLGFTLQATLKPPDVATPTWCFSRSLDTEAAE